AVSSWLAGESNAAGTLLAPRAARVCGGRYGHEYQSCHNPTGNDPSNSDTGKTPLRAVMGDALLDSASCSMSSPSSGGSRRTVSCQHSDGRWGTGNPGFDGLQAASKVSGRRGATTSVTL